jgi:hypothetical protein
MARLRLLVVCTAAALIAAANLSAAEKKAAKSPAARPRMKAAAETEPDPFADAKPSNPPVRPPQKAAAKRRPEPSIIGTPSRPGEAEAKIEAALNSRTVMDFNEAPLQDVIDYLKEAHKIEIQVDKRVLEDVNVTVETPVTINVRGVSLRSALNLMLRNMQPELTYVIRNEVLLITTPGIESLETKLYDVADLVVCRDEHDTLWDDYESLIELITNTVASTSWEDVGAPGTISGVTLGTAKVLVVTQTPENHREIVGLLAKIREIAKKNPGAGIPRRDRPPETLKHDANRTVPASVTKPVTIAPNVAKPPEQKPVEQKPTEPAPAQPKPPGGMPGGMPGTMPSGMR